MSCRGGRSSGWVVGERGAVALEAQVADQTVVGKVGRVTGTIAPGRLGEVMIPIRGGSEAYHARAAGSAETISVGSRIVVVEYFPPRTVLVTPM